MKMKLLSAVAASVLCLASTSSALTVSYDSYSDASGGNSWEVYSIGHGTDGTNLYIEIVTGYLFPIQNGGDSYAGNTPLSPGDIYLNKNGSHNAGTGTVSGLGVTNHSGDITSDPNDAGLPWSAVVAGHLYSNAQFVTGTYEGYNGADQLSEDGGNDPYGHANNIPVLIAGYAADLGAQGFALDLLNGGALTQINPDGTLRSNVWRISATIALSALGLADGDDYEIWWAPECGNDAHYVKGTVPEPASLGLLGLGLLGIGSSFRKRARSSH